MAEASSELFEPENLFQDAERDDSVDLSRAATDEPSANEELLSAGDDNETVYSMEGWETRHRLISKEDDDFITKLFFP